MYFLFGARALLNIDYILLILTFIIEKKWSISAFNAYIQNLLILFLTLIINCHSPLSNGEITKTKNLNTNRGSEGRKISNENPNDLEKEKDFNEKDSLSGYLDDKNIIKITEIT